MKNHIARILLALMVLTMLTGCGDESPTDTQPVGADTPSSTSSTTPSATDSTTPTATDSTTPSATEGSDTPSEEEIEQQLDAQLDALVAGLEGVLDTSALERKAQPVYFSPTINGAGTREYSLKVSSGAAAIDSVKLDQLEFAGSAPVTVAQLMDTGWSCDHLDETIEPSFVGLVPCQTPDGKNVIIRGLNATEETLTFQDCLVSGVDAEYDGLSFPAASAANLQINGSLITRTTSLTKFIELVGCPNEIYVVDTFSNWTYQYSRIQLKYQNKGPALTVYLTLSNGTAELQSVCYDFSFCLDFS